MKGILKEPGTDKTSSSRVILVFSVGLVFGIWVAIVAGIWFTRHSPPETQIAWERFAGAMDWARDYLLVVVIPYGVNMLRRAAKE